MLYPKPKAWIVPFRLVSETDFCNVLTIPSGGLTLGSPSVKRTVKTFLF